MQPAKRLAALPAGQMLTVTRCLFTEPNDYGAGFDEGEADFVVSASARFRASYDRIEIERLRIIIGEEEVARATHVRLRGDDALITFPLAKSSTVIVRGEGVQCGELIWHNPGDRFHEWISGPVKWVRIRLTVAALSEAASNLKLPAPLALRSGHVIVLEPMRREALLTAVRKVAALARLCHDNGPPLDPRHSIERGLLRSLVCALADPIRSPQIRSPQNRSSQRYHEIMLRLEDLVSPRLQQSVQCGNRPRAAHLRANAENLLRGASRYGTPSLSAAPTADDGPAPPAAVRTPYDDRCRRGAPVWFSGARAVCGDLPASFWRATVRHPGPAVSIAPIRTRESGRITTG